MARLAPWAQPNAALTTAAPRLATTKTRRGGRTSSRFMRAATNEPATKPTWTAIVSHEAAEGPKCHTAVSGRTTAVPENQVLIDSRVASASQMSAAQRPAADSTAGIGVL